MAQRYFDKLQNELGSDTIITVLLSCSLNLIKFENVD